MATLSRVLFAWIFASTLALPTAFAQQNRLPPRPDAPLPPGVRVMKDLAYVTDGHERQKLDLYLPEKVDADTPVVIYIHGGAWLAGSKQSAREMLHLVSRGFAVAAVNYRLSQHAPFPAQIEDCKAAVRWLRAHSKEYRLDPARFGAIGGSAGGHLVALLGTTGEIKDFDVGENLSQSSQVQAVCDWFGPTDFLQMKGSHDDRSSPESKLIGGPILENKEKVSRANPITYVTRKSPPFLIMHGDNDRTVPFNQSELLHDALKKAQVDVTFIPIKGAGHGGPMFHTAEVSKTVGEFFAKHLQPAAQK